MNPISDNLKVGSNTIITQKIGNEKVYFSCLVKKHSKKLYSNIIDRIFFITNVSIYKFKANEPKKLMKLNEIKAVTISEKSYEFIIHGNQEAYDHLFISLERKNILEALHTHYYNITKQDLLLYIN